MDETTRRLSEKLSRLNLLHRLHIFHAANEFGLYLGQMPILDCVAKNDRCTQRELCETLHVSPPSVATSVKRMQRAGLITKMADESDLRYTRLSLTEQGRRVAAEGRKLLDGVDGLMFHGIPPKERELFEGVLQRMIDNLAVDEWQGETMFSLMQKQLDAHAQRAKEKDR